MGATKNVELIEDLQRAVREQDFDRYGQLLADDATFRTAGVPAGLGGVLTGREAIVDQFRQTAGASSSEIKQIFGDDEHVCVVGKVTAERFLGSRYLRGAERPYSTYECIVYRIADEVAESPRTSTGSTPTSNSASSIWAPSSARALPADAVVAGRRWGAAGRSTDVGS